MFVDVLLFSMSVVEVGGNDSKSFPSKLVNKFCIRFVYEFHLMSKDNLDSVFVCILVSEGEKRATVIGIFADAGKQQQHEKALEGKDSSCISTKRHMLCTRGSIIQKYIWTVYHGYRGGKRYISIQLHGE